MQKQSSALILILFSSLVCLISCNEYSRMQENFHIALTENGITPITSQTRYELLEIDKLFPSFEVKEVTRYELDFPVVYISISRASRELINIYPDYKVEKIESIAIKDKIVINKLGPKLGALYGEIYKSINHNKCIRKSIKIVTHIECQAPHSNQVWYIFTNTWVAERNEFPPLDSLRTWPLSELIWRPNSKNDYI